MLLASGARHPWPCLWFVGPLWLLYEVGIWRLSAQGQAVSRCGVDLWLRWWGDQFGLPAISFIPALALVFLAFASFWRWKERPASTPLVLLAMLIESLIAAVVLWWLSRNFDLVCQRAGIPLAVAGVSFAQLLTLFGAGIYEELVFRFGLFTLLCFLLRLVFLPRLLAIPLAALTSALLFSLAHHVGPWGEAWRLDYFLFRTVAGLYFTALYLFRGLGVAVGAHVVYDLLIGLSQPPGA
jgi:membrane protease YdiL (CAAX protease family)